MESMNEAFKMINQAMGLATREPNPKPTTLEEALDREAPKTALIAQRYKIGQMEKMLARIAGRRSRTSPVVLAYSRYVDAALNQFEEARRRAG